MRFRCFLLAITVLFSFLPFSFAEAQGRPIVRLIYFLPRDRAPQPDIDVKLDALIKDVQQAYAGTMAGHGFGRKTFRFETDVRGNAVVHHVKGQLTDKHYSALSLVELSAAVWREIDGQFDTLKNIYLTAIDVSSEGVPRDGSCGGIAGPIGAFGGEVLIPASGPCFNAGLTIHELGHAFGLHHDIRGDATRIQSHISDWMASSFCAAEWLSVHRAFNSDRPDSDKLPTIKMHPPSFAAPPNAIRFRFTVTDPDGLHQVQLHTRGDSGYNLLLGCKRSSGTSNRTVEFVTPHLRSNSKSVSLQMIDVHGNLFRSSSYPINVSSLLPRAKVVSIPDANLAAAVRREIGSSITTHTMLNFIWLKVPNRGITRLTGLEHAHNLSSLNLGNEYIDRVGPVNSNAVSDISPLAGFRQLWELDLSGNAISDVSPLAGLKQLWELDLSGNAISDISSLAGLKQLRELDLSDNTISDISSLAGLKQLRELDLSDNTISDISSLADLKQLTYLELESNAISDVSSLADLKQLTSLWLADNAISDVSSLAGLKQLITLNLRDNAISDVSSLADLKQLRRLYLGDNTISDVSSLAGLKQLKRLSLYNNAISDVSSLAGLKQLTSLWLADNAISDVSSLAGLKQLTHLYLFNNNISDISSLVQLNLTGEERDSTGLSLERNPLNYAAINTHIPAMQARGIEVQFDNRTPKTLIKISGAAQQTIANTVLPLPFVVEVKDQRNHAFAGVPVTFAISAGNGRLSTTSATTDLNGRAQAHLTLGQTTGTTTVRVTAAKIPQPVQFTATAILVSTPIVMPDVNLRAKVVVALNKEPEHPITVVDMLTLTELTANNANIRTLTGLQYAVNLKTLSLDDNSISDVASLEVLTQLETLSLDDNNISDVAPLEVLTQLETLSLDDNNISDVTPLERLTQLQTLSLDNNNISHVAPLEALTQLKTLHLKGNLLSYPSLHTFVPTFQADGATVTVDPRIPTTLVQISSTRGVAGTALTLIVEVQDENGFGFSGVPVTFTVTAGGGHLSASNLITDVTGRARTTLTLGATPGKNIVRATAVEGARSVSFTITTVDANSRVTVRDTNLHAKIAETLGKPRGVQLTVGDMLMLTRLDALNANIQNLSGLEHAHNLTYLNLSGEYVTEERQYVNSNTVSDFSPLEGLNQLRSLHFSNNELADISSLSGLTQLTNLSLSSNFITDVAPLAGLTQLTFLNLNYNRIVNVSPLARLTQLTFLNLSGNRIVNVSPLARLTQLTFLNLFHNLITDVAPLAGLTQLTNLLLNYNRIVNVSPLAGLTQLTFLTLRNNRIVDVSPLARLTQLTNLHLYNNLITDVSPLVGLNLTGTEWRSIGLGLERNPLSYASINTHIPAMQAKGVEIKFDNRAHSVLVKISGDTQEGEAGARLATPFVVEAMDPHGAAMTGLLVTFRVIEGDGKLSAITATTDANGRVRTILTLGPNPGVNTVRVTAPQITYPVTFTAIATEASRLAADVNADGVVNIQDLVLVSSNFGQTGQNIADVNADGVVNIADLVLVAGAFGGGAAAPTHPTVLAKLSVADIQRWLDEATHLKHADAAYLRGIVMLEQLLVALIPKETDLLPNYPNPFNPETWVPYQLVKPSEVTLHIYSINGTLVRTLALGHQSAGMYHSKSRAAYWDGRNEQGERVASGVYFYTLSAGDFTATRKMLIKK